MFREHSEIVFAYSVMGILLERSSSIFLWAECEHRQIVNVFAVSWSERCEEDYWIKCFCVSVLQQTAASVPASASDCCLNQEASDVHAFCL